MSVAFELEIWFVDQAYHFYRVCGNPLCCAADACQVHIYSYEISFESDGRQEQDVHSDYSMSHY